MSETTTISTPLQTVEAIGNPTNASEAVSTSSTTNTSENQRYTEQEVVEMRKSADIKNLELLSIQTGEPFPKEEIDNYIDNFIVSNGGTLAELFVKLPSGTSPQVLEYIKQERQQQVDIINDYLQLFNPLNEGDKDQDPIQNQQIRREMIANGFFFYAKRFKEVRSLEQNIPSQHVQEFQEITSEALRNRSEAQRVLTQNIVTTINKVTAQSENLTGENTTLPSPVSSVEIETPALVQKEPVPTLQGKDPKTKEIKRYNISDAVSDVLPFLIAMDSTLAYAKGGYPQLMTMMREVDEIMNGPKSNEKILASFNVSPQALELLKRDKVTEEFFKLFIGKEKDLMDFFEQMNPHNGNMFLFLEKLSTIDLRIMIEQKKLPGGITIDDEELALILGKLKPYERAQLGIHDKEAKMR